MNQEKKKLYINKHKNGNCTLYTYVEDSGELSYYLSLSYRKGNKYNTKTLSIQKDELPKIVRVMQKAFMCPRSVYI